MKQLLLQRTPTLRLFQLFEQDPDGPVRKGKPNDWFVVHGLFPFKPGPSGEDTIVLWGADAFSKNNSKLSTQAVDSAVALGLTPEQQKALLEQIAQAKIVEEQIAGLQHADAFARSLRMRERLQQLKAEGYDLEAPSILRSLFGGWTHTGSTLSDSGLPFNTSTTPRILSASTTQLLNFDLPLALARPSMALALPAGKSMDQAYLIPSKVIDHQSLTRQREQRVM